MFLNKRKSKQELKMSGCPICNSGETKNFLKKDDKELIICKNCRHIFWSKLPTNDELSNYYTYKYSENHNQVDIQSQDREYYCRHLEELTSFMNIEPKNTTILDYGCSYPVLLMEAKEMGFNKVIGVEYDKNCIITGERNGIDMLNPDDFETSIKAHSIDIIRFSHVLEHLVDPRKILQTAVKKLKYGGLIYITQPNLPVFLSKEHNGIEIKDAVYPEHLHFFSPISLKIMVEDMGLKVIKFFTHQNAEDVIRRYITNIDFNTCAEELLSISDKGDNFFGTYCNFPIYAGENSVMYMVLSHQ